MTSTDSSSKQARTAILLPEAMASLTLTNYCKLAANMSGRDKLMRFVCFSFLPLPVD